MTPQGTVKDSGGEGTILGVFMRTIKAEETESW